MIGAQSPRISIQPKRESSDGDDAGLFFSAYAYKLDEWQAETLACWLGKDAAGQYNVMSAGLSVPRQNGKNSCLEAREFFGLIVIVADLHHPVAHAENNVSESLFRLAPVRGIERLLKLFV